MRNTIILFAALTILFSCGKKLGEVSAPAFDVSLEKTTFKVGETITFIFSGEPTNITFYSGLPFNEYAYKDKDRVYNIADSGVVMDFATQLSATATGVTYQTKQLSVLISTDFNGNYTFDNIQQATWTDLTPNFTLASATTNQVSGTKDISSYFDSGGPVYIGFRYTTLQQEKNGTGRGWFIQSLNVKSKADPVGGKNLLVSDQQHAGFRIIDQYPTEKPTSSTVIVSPPRITLAPNAFYKVGDSLYVEGSEWNDPKTITWAVSKPLQKDSANFGRDWGTSLKGTNTDYVEQYTYKYNTPGTYKAFFVASNSTINDIKETVKEITITIVP